jgi:hypothetical protein
MILDGPELRNERAYRTLRIPASVAEARLSQNDPLLQLLNMRWSLQLQVEDEVSKRPSL